MHLMRLELTGFKSFAELTRLDFAPGLNAVVGPNGSGKSNIADALRWVLGEQSVRQLRGGKMEDVIFAGTAHRRALGFADITMRLDNSDNTLPLDFKVVTVTRRLYRSGESEYAINGERCRLKDVQGLFMDTGIGRDGYSIIGQGRIGEILSIRSEDRRLIFEEAAGIAGFKSKRNEALSKLAAERQNIVRIDDIIGELAEQMPQLEAESDEARKYLQLRDEYKGIHINTTLGEIGRNGTELAHASEALENTKAQSEGGSHSLSLARKLSEELKEKTSRAELEYRSINENLLHVTKEIEKKQGELKLLETGIAGREAEITRLKGEDEKRQAGIASKEEGINSENERLAIVRAELHELKLELDVHIEESTRYEELMREDAAKRDSLNGAVMASMNRVTDSRGAVNDSENFYRRLEGDKERLDEAIESNEGAIAREGEAIENLEEAVQALDRDLVQERAREAAYVSAYASIREEAQCLDAELNKNRESLTAGRGRLRALADLEAGFEGYYRSVKAILARKHRDPAFSGICGAVSELIGVEAKYETAIEIALGSGAQNIVTETEEDAKLAIETLKKSKEGRATFLPLTAVKGRRTESLIKDPGFLGIASELVSCEPVFAPVVSQLLGDIYIVDNLNNALAIHKRYGYSKKIVTLEGERLSPGGAIAGGSLARQTAGIIGRSRRVDELKAEVGKLEKEQANLETKAQDLGERRQSTRDALGRSRDRVQSLSIEEQKQRADLEQKEKSQTRLKEAMKNFLEENDRLMAQLVEANGAVRAAKLELEKQEAAHAESRAVLEEYQAEMEAKRREHTEEAEELTGLRIEISKRDEWVSGAEKNIERLQSEKLVLISERELIQREALADEALNKEGRISLEKYSDDLVNLDKRLEEIRSGLMQNESERASLKESIVAAEEDERAESDAKNLLEQEIVRLTTRIEALNATSHRLHNELWEEYELTPNSAEMFKRQDLSEIALRRRAAELKSELAGMADINVGAIEAFKQLRTRHDFLCTQRNDIVEAEEALKELVSSLTAQMESRFSESFDKINAHFGEVFKEIFDGGTAGLRLMDTDNILESGIEITAQPPGKKLQSLMLLSGGEMALTAIALLFAILRLKPSPFCVLDEIESALDDANISRFAKFIKEYSKSTQFIVITHRKGTMEAADNLYGVTMEEQGISKLVSVRLVTEE